MIDKKLVINGLECAKRLIRIGPGTGSRKCRAMDACDNAIAMLKEQEAVKPEREHSGGGTTWWNVCGNCKTAINPNDKYCHECGRAVMWKRMENE